MKTEDCGLRTVDSRLWTLDCGLYTNFRRNKKTMLHIRLLGKFLITDGNDNIIGLTRPRLKTLLAYLALHQETPLPKAKVAEFFWQPSPDAQPVTNLRNLRYYLRRELPELNEYITFGKSVTWKSNAPCWLDVATFERALAQAVATTEPLAQQTALVEALALYTGDLWPQCQDDWIFPFRERLRNQYISALEQLIDLMEGAHDYADALVAAQRLLLATPLREASYRRVMQIQAALGDHTGIERTFAECQSQLQRKWQIAPSAPTRELYERLTQSATAAVTRQLLPLIERQREWVHLQQLWTTAQQGHPHCLLLTGDPGIGKTRLLTEFVASVERQGLAALIAECQPFTLTMAYATLLTWLRTPLLRRRLTALAPARRADLAPLLPELSDEPTASPTLAMLESWQRQRMYETLALLFVGEAFLAQTEPLLLALDNAQWCDQGTLDWLHYLIVATPTARLFIVGAFSPLELRPHYPVARLQPRLQQSHLVTEVRLAPLTPNGVAALGQALTGEPLSAVAIAQLYQVTEGNPLYLMEALRALQVDDQRLQESDHITNTLLQSLLVQAALQSFLGNLSAEAQDIVGLAATIGYTFCFDLLASAALVSHEPLLLALDELLQKQILCDTEADGYRFTRYLLQQAVYSNLSSAKRRLWQARVTAAQQQLRQG